MPTGSTAASREHAVKMGTACVDTRADNLLCLRGPAAATRERDHPCGAMRAFPLLPYTAVRYHRMVRMFHVWAQDGDDVPCAWLASCLLQLKHDT
jgi:hypothetical protein